MQEIFKTVTPEEVGVKSENVKKFYEKLEELQIASHSVLMLRGDKIFTEAYWKPFHKDFGHRMYSQTKSFVAIAIGLLVEDGLISLDDKICDYFRDKIDTPVHEYLEAQTIRDMLTMTTCLVSDPLYKNKDNDKDRIHIYFNRHTITKPSGTTWAYDSPGSQVLCALVERVAKKPMLDLLKERIFNHIGSFKNAQILKIPTGESWGDSAMICTARDMATFGRFVLNYGTWNGKRLMSEEFLKEATSPLVDNSLNNHPSFHHVYGYGYQIWRIGDDCFAFLGMGNQITICNTKNDVIFVCNMDTQCSGYNEDVLFNLIQTYIYDDISVSSLPKNDKAYSELQEYISKLTLRTIRGKKDHELVDKINGKVFKPLAENPQGITEFSLSFNADGSGTFNYTNAQGKKKLDFKYGENAYQKFPQLGYSDLVSITPAGGNFMYDCAVSGAWTYGNRFAILVQIIDKYFGNLTMFFDFKGDIVNVRMAKVAEYFLDEYNGSFTAKMQE